MMLPYMPGKDKYPEKLSAPLDTQCRLCSYENDLLECPILSSSYYLEAAQPSLLQTLLVAVSDLRPLPSLINRALTYLALKELKLSRHMSLPFGSSIFAIAKKQ